MNKRLSKYYYYTSFKIKVTMWKNKQAVKALIEDIMWNDTEKIWVITMKNSNTTINCDIVIFFVILWYFDIFCDIVIFWCVKWYVNE